MADDKSEQVVLTNRKMRNLRGVIVALLQHDLPFRMSLRLDHNLEATELGNKAYEKKLKAIGNEFRALDGSDKPIAVRDEKGSPTGDFEIDVDRMDEYSERMEELEVHEVGYRFLKIKMSALEALQSKFNIPVQGVVIRHMTPISIQDVDFMTDSEKLSRGENDDDGEKPVGVAAVGKAAKDAENDQG